MAIRNIVLEGDPILTKKCRVVERFDDRLAQLIDDMKETMTLKDGVGLAAPQVGVLKRVIVILYEEDKIIELVNPKIIESSGMQEDAEGCLSCPGEYGITRRPMNVKVKAQDRFGKEHVYEGEALLARAFCHEIDHLDGILFKEHVIRMLDSSELEVEK